MRSRLLFPCILALSVLTQCAVSEPEPPRPAPAERSSTSIVDRLADDVSSDKRLFLSYNPAGRSVWNPVWASRLDLTGVAWESPRTATAITPRHVVMAAHYPRKPGDTLVFHDRDGTRHARTLVKVVSLRAKPTVVDIAVGLLDRPLPKSIKTYPLLEPASDYGDRLAGGQALVTNQHRQLLIRNIRFVNKRFIGFDYQTNEPPPSRIALIKGDSGNPSFLLLKDGMVLAETHTGGGGGAGPFYSSPNTVKGIAEAVRELDPNHAIRTVPLDAEYARLAVSRRTELDIYNKINPDGTLKNAPRPVQSPDARTSPGPPAGPAKSTPAKKNAPRVRRVPTPQKS